MALTRRSFFGRIAAIAVGAVLAARPRVSPKPVAATFEHRAYGGVVFVTDEHMNRDRIMFISEQYRELLGREASRAEITSNIIRRYHELIKQDVFFAMSGGPKELGAGSGIGWLSEGVLSGS